MSINKYKVSVDKLRNYFDPAKLTFDSTEEVEPIYGVVGQKRVEQSLKFGLGAKTDGFNIFATGFPGTNKLSTIKDYVEKLSSEQEKPSDWCYIFNFKHPDRPVAIKLPPGIGTQFSQDMDELIVGARNEIPKAFESEDYEKRKSRVIESYGKIKEGLLSELEDKAAKVGFSVELATSGVVTVPIYKGKILRKDEYEKLSEEEKQRIKNITKEIQAEAKLYLSRARSLEKEAKEQIHNFEHEIAMFAVGHLLDELRKKYKSFEDVIKYLDEVQDDIIENLDSFKETEKRIEGIFPGFEILHESIFERYKVNIAVNNAETNGSPVVIEPNPTYYNLFGKLEYKAQFGAMSTSFMNIKTGAFHRANGGYIILDALDVLLNLFSWGALKRTLKTKELMIENIGEHFQAFPAATLKPASIPVNVKVIMIGHPMIYHLLFMLDEDFQKLFKVKADFDTRMERNEEFAHKYAQLISKKCRDSNLKHFDRTGIAKVVEYGSRNAENQQKLSIKVMEIEDLISEASYWASTNGSHFVTGSDVKKAIDERIYRSNLIEERINELIEDGTIIIDTAEKTIGQINGIAVADLGNYSFGKPSRITARTFIGRKGLINIEREANLSGRIHNKGVMILSGYLGGKYAMDKPLAMSATLTFEQLYDEVEGDSASSAELYAILSSLSEVPINQGIAVTGSVNQYGEIQAIGGINQKIEGFFDVCKIKGLTGNQGVLMPWSNIKNLMLREDVIEEIKKGNFNIWAIKSIDEGIEILTGKKAGKIGLNGRYPKDTINWLVNEKLEHMAKQLKKFAVEKESEPTPKVERKAA